MELSPSAGKGAPRRVVPSAEESGAGSEAGIFVRLGSRLPVGGRRRGDVAGRSVADLARRRPSGARRQGQSERVRSKAATAGYRECWAPSRQGRANGDRWSSEPLFPGLDATTGRAPTLPWAAAHGRASPAIGVYGYWYSVIFAPQLFRTRTRPCRLRHTPSAICRSSIAWLGRMPWSPQHKSARNGVAPAIFASKVLHHPPSEPPLRAKRSALR